MHYGKIIQWLHQMQQQTTQEIDKTLDLHTVMQGSSQPCSGIPGQVGFKPNSGHCGQASSWHMAPALRAVHRPKLLLQPWLLPVSAATRAITYSCCCRVTTTKLTANPLTTTRPLAWGDRKAVSNVEAARRSRIRNWSMTLTLHDDHAFTSCVVAPQSRHRHRSPPQTRRQTWGVRSRP